MELIYLDLEDERPGFIEDPTFNVIPDILPARLCQSKKAFLRFIVKNR